MKRLRLLACLLFVSVATGSLAGAEEVPGYPGLTKVAEDIYSYIDAPDFRTNGFRTAIPALIIRQKRY